MKTCKKCKVEKPKSEFHPFKKGGEMLYPRCIVCTRAEHREWYRKTRATRIAKSREAHLKRAAVEGDYRKPYRDSRKHILRAQHLAKTYGISVERYDEMFKSQNGGCAICSGQNLDGKRLYVDHNHTTGAVRGLLCGKCNNAIGLFKESPDILTAAWAYLVRHFKKSTIQEAVK